MIQSVVCYCRPDLVRLSEPKNRLKGWAKIPYSPALPLTRGRSISTTVEYYADTLGAVRGTVAHPSQHVLEGKANILKRTNTPVRETATGKDEHRPARF